MARKGNAQIILSVLWIAAMLFWNPVCKQGAAEGLRLCGTLLIPALFPFSVLSGLCIRTGLQEWIGKTCGRFTGRAFGLPGEAAAPAVLGLLGGYPIGAYCLSDLCKRKALSREEALRASAICNQTGPAFLLGAVGPAVLQSPALGLAVYLVCLLSAAATGILLKPSGSAYSIRRLYSSEGPQSNPPESILQALPKALWDGTQAMLRVTGIVVFFCAGFSVLRVWAACLRLPDWAGSLIWGFMELTGGVLSLADLPRPFRLFLCGCLVNWGGICVHLQAADALMEAGLPIGPYLRGKLIQTAIAAILSALLTVCLYPDRVPLPVPAAVFPVLFIIFLYLLKFHWKKRRTVL